MKKNRLKKGISIALAASMLLGLAACGKGGSGGKTADPNLAKQYVYSSQELEIPGMEEGNNIDVRKIHYQDGMIYLLMNVFNWEDGSNSQTMKLISLNEDGTNVQEITMQLPESNAGNGGTQEDGAEDTSSQDSSEGGDSAEAVGETEAASETESSENLGISTLPAGPASENRYEYTGYDTPAFSADGYLYALKNHTLEDYSDPENPISENESTLCKWDLQGNLLGEYPLQPVDPETALYINGLIPMEDGSVSILYTGDSVQASVVDAQGNVSPRKELPNASAIAQNGATFVPKNGNELIVTYYNDSDWSKMLIATYDLASDTLSEGTPLPSSMSMSGYNALTAGFDTDLVYSDSNGVYTLNVGDTEPKQMMSFVNSDMNIASMNNLVMLDENRFLGIYSDSIDYKTSAAIFTKVKPEDIPDKQVLVMAGMWLDSDVRQRVVDFNKSSDAYRIVLTEYNKYNTQEDYMAGYTQLNNDIISGNIPDILVVDNQFPLENYVAKGLIADIGELIEKDEELSQIGYLQNVFDAFSIDGKLYQVIPYFSVMTMAGKTAHIGDRTTWTMKDMQEVMEGMPEGAVAMSDMNRRYFMSMMMQYCATDFVDISTGKCAFDSQNFIDMLEFAKTLPEELDEENYTDAYWENYEAQYREDRTLLMNVYINEVRSMNSIMNGSFGEPVSFVGFPTESGKGSVISTSGNTFAISAKSKNVDGAWQFVRQYLTEEYQKELQWGLPTIESIFDEKAQLALQKPFYINENGEKIEYNDTFYMNGESIELEPMSQEQVDQVVSFIKSVDRRQYFNNSINDIILEESEAFFTGQKSAQEVAGTIQSRVQIYVSENM